MTEQQTPKIIECPRCGEGDERSVGLNRCGLCEAEFRVTWWALEPRLERHRRNKGATVREVSGGTSD